MVNVNNEEQNNLISIIKTHTANINTSISPRRHTHSPFCSHHKYNERFGKSEAKPNGIRATIDASRFFSKPKNKKNSNFNTNPSSNKSIELTSQPTHREVEQKITEIETNQNEHYKNKELLEFIKVVKIKFSEIESELEKTKGELVYFKRKSEEQAEVIEELRKRERYLK